MSVSVDINLKEIYDLLCEECKKKAKRLIAEKVSERLLEGRLT